MNSEIAVMVDLQESWDRVLKSQILLARNEELIRTHERELADFVSRLDESHRELMKLKGAIKEREISLAELDVRSGKLLERKNTLLHTKEIEAAGREIETIQADISELEDEMLAMMDGLSAAEASRAALQEKATERRTAHGDTDQRLGDEIRKHLALKDAAQNAFDSRLPDLDAKYRSRFQKLLQGREGKALAAIISETCTVCHYQVPSALAMDAGRDDRVVICTNCGRFIYRQA